MNNSHPLALELQKLRESSKHSVAFGNEYNFDKFKEYLHIEREVEIILKDKIIECSKASGPKLLLVCGNVGDGKSHILSYLNKELKKEIALFDKMHNDATEAHNPNEDSKQTLFKLLENFQDSLMDQASEKIILAINLGTLSNFLEEYGDKFTTLLDYVNDKKILDTDLLEDEQSTVSPFFNHVNFADYHMYSLTADGPISTNISSLLDKIVANDERNILYKAYLESKELTKGINDPIVMNFEFLINEKHRDTVSDLLIQAIVKHKEIISLRALLNFFFDLIVPIGLPWESMGLYLNKLKDIKSENLLDLIIPNYLFEHKELSSIFNKINLLDPCQRRYFKLDQEIINLVNSDKPKEIFERFIGPDCDQGILEPISDSNVSTKSLPKLLIRLNFFSNRENAQELSDPYYKEFMVNLYYFNKQEKKNTQNIYLLVMESARKWFGDPKQDKKVVLDIGQKQSKYRVFKEFKLDPKPSFGAEQKKDVLVKFVQEITLFFNHADGIERLHLDFGLYKILNQIKEGYLPNKKDNSNYLSFLKSIKKLINHDSKEAGLDIDKVNVGNFTDFRLEKDAFENYTFRRV